MLDGRVAIYCRLSDEDRDKVDKSQDSKSIQTQKNMLIKYATDQGWEIYRIYSDDDFSGIDASRVEYNQLLQDAANHKFDIVLCKHQSRFTRDVEHVERYINNKFTEWGIRFISLLDGADTDIRSNKKTRQINGLVNEWYLEELSENQRASQKSRKADGKYLGSSFPYGYLKDPMDVNHLIIDPVASEIVKRIFNMYMVMGGDKIARIFNEEGIPSPARYKTEILNIRFHNNLAGGRQKIGKPPVWASSTVYMILKNETYLGNLAQNRTNTISYKNQTRIKNKTEDWIRAENTHDAIINIDLFMAAESIRKTRKRPNKRTDKQYLLSGVLRCGYCGSNLIVSSAPTKTRCYYACHHHKVYPSECPGLNASQKTVSEAVLSQLKTYLNSMDPDRVASHIHVQAKNNLELDSVKKMMNDKTHKSEKLEIVLKELYMDKATGLISAEQFAELNRSYTVDKNKLHEEISHLAEKILGIEQQRQQLEKTVSDRMLILNTARRYINAETLTREMVVSFVDYIVVNEGEGYGVKNIEIHWKF